MTPIKYTIKGDTTFFHYRFKDLRNFVFHHLDSGAAGVLFWARRGNYEIYKCSGTLENPLSEHNSVKDLRTLSMAHNTIFDGKRKTNDECLIPPKEMEWLLNHRIVFIDMSDEKGKPNIQEL